MHIEAIDLPRSFYTKYLETINGIKFTHREIDIIAFTVSGRSSKKIASLLSISPRTVENHIRNIMMKVECNSREAIIDFVEKSGKLALLKEYYLKSVINAEFEKCLKSLSISKEEAPFVCEIIYWQGHYDLENSLAHHLADHLKLVGISSLLKAGENNISGSEIIQEPFNANYRVYVLPPEFPMEEEKKEEQTLFLSLKKNCVKNNVLLLLSERPPSEQFSKEFSHFNCIELSKQKNYYYLVFEIFKRIFPQVPTFEKVIADFQRKEEALNNISAFLPSQSYEESANIKQYHGFKIRDFLRNRRYLVLSSLLITSIVGSLGFLTYKGYFEGKQKGQVSISVQPIGAIRSDLMVPTETTLLDRSDLLIQMENKLKEHPTRIQTIALVGMGGAGKTTLARQYSRLQKMPIVWEINAETRETLIRSFESLAYVLSQTEEEKKAIKGLQDINNPIEREEKITQWVKKHLRTLQSWLLIYDNVEKFSDIQKYFPSDPDAWGSGIVIITTRDSNIQNNSHINNIIQIGELSSQDRLNIFIKIMTNGGKNPFTHSQKEQARKFLENIPPFPLDISSAAYYIKATNITFAKYLEHLNEYNKDFAALQENVLKETSGHTKTRYSILSLSLKRLIDTHQDFASLLLFISLLDSQNIPRSLLDAYKSEVIVDNFVYYLKNYSLITPQSFTPFNSVATFSMHRSTQEITLAYLIKSFKLNKDNQILQSIGNTLRNYMSDVVSREDLPKMKVLASHSEVFLAHSNLLGNEIAASVGGELGGIYFYFGNYVKAKQILEESFTNLNRNYNKNYPHIAQILSYLGVVSRELGNYEEAKDLLEQSLQIYKHHLSENHVGMARVLVYSGMVSRELGNYEEAKGLLEQSLLIYKQHLPKNHVGIARVLGYLGIVSRELGSYEEAKSLLEQSLTIYKQYLPENHIGMAWNLMHLGKVYKELGKYEKAKYLMEEGFEIFKQHLPENHLAWVLVYLGGVYKELGNYEKAKNLLEQSLVIYQKTLPENHVYTAWALAVLGSIYKELDNYEKAKNCFEKTFIIYEKKYGKDHIEIARILNEMGQTYLRNGQVEAAENHINRALKIFEKRNHPERYISLEALTELYLKKSVDDVINKGTSQKSQNFKQQAMDYLKQAYNVMENYFPEDSPHIIRVQSKLKKLE